MCLCTKFVVEYTDKAFTKTGSRPRPRVAEHDRTLSSTLQSVVMVRRMEQSETLFTLQWLGAEFPS